MDQETDYYLAAAAVEDTNFKPLNHPGFNTPVDQEDLYGDDRGNRISSNQRATSADL